MGADIVSSHPPPPAPAISRVEKGRVWFAGRRFEWRPRVFVDDMCSQFVVFVDDIALPRGCCLGMNDSWVGLLSWFCRRR